MKKHDVKSTGAILIICLPCGYSFRNALSIESTFTATYYCPNMEEALRRAKIAGKKSGCYFGGFTLKSGRKGFAIYREGKVVERYSVIALKKG